MHNTTITIKPQVFDTEMEISCLAICEDLNEKQIMELATKEIMRIAQKHIREISGHDFKASPKKYKPTEEDTAEWAEIVASNKMQIAISEKLSGTTRRTRETTLADNLDKMLASGKTPEQVLAEMQMLIANRSKEVKSKK